MVENTRQSKGKEKVRSNGKKTRQRRRSWVVVVEQIVP